MKSKFVIRKYPKTMGGYLLRKATETKLFAKGYIVYSEEEIKEFSAGKGCLLGLIFLPLILFGKKKYVKVTYSLPE